MEPNLDFVCGAMPWKKVSVKAGSATMAGTVLTINLPDGEVAVYNCDGLEMTQQKAHIGFNPRRPDLSIWSLAWDAMLQFPDVLFVQHPDPQNPAKRPSPIFRYLLRTT